MQPQRHVWKSGLIDVCINIKLGFLKYLRAVRFFQSVGLVFSHLPVSVCVLSCLSFQLCSISVLIILKG